MKIYQTNIETGEFITESTAEKCPLGGGFLMPAGAVEIAPPDVGKNEIAVWNGAAWDKQPDWRGFTGYDADGNEFITANIGDIPAVGLYSQPITAPGEISKWNGKAWEIVPDFRGESGYDSDGNYHEITELGVKPQPEWTQEPPPQPEPTPADNLAATDSGFIRVTEDLIETLVNKGVIAMTDLPKAAQDKIAARADLRAKI